MMSGWGSGWWLVGGVFMVICMVMMVRMMGGMMGHGHSGNAGHGWRDEPERTLADRLARGEIDIEEYNRLLETLQGTRSTRS
jgi:putative membrane protein